MLFSYNLCLSLYQKCSYSLEEEGEYREDALVDCMKRWAPDNRTPHIPL